MKPVLNELPKFDQNRTTVASGTTLDGSDADTRSAGGAHRSFNETRLRAFFFNDGAERLFGVYYPPSVERRGGLPVLICPPVGHEYVRSYNAIRKLCGRLAEHGFPVLKFDYSGLGDSCGDGSESHTGEWRENIRAAASELCRQAGQTEINVVGVRLGATLASGIRINGAIVRSLVLWDPVVDGAGYVAELRHLHRACLVDTLRYRKPQSHRISDRDLLGVRWPPRLEESIVKLKLLNRPFPYDNVFLATSTQGPLYEALAEDLTRNTKGRFTREIVPEPAGWDDHRQVEAALSANRMVAAISGKLVDGFV